MADPRVAVVTGGQGEIGGGTVVALSKRGLDVVVCDRAQDEAIADGLRARADPGARLAFATADVADLNDHPRSVEAIFAAFGRVDCLVNNAGVSAMARGDLLDVSVESFDLNFDVNTRGTFFLIQAVCRGMLATPGDFPESARS